VAVASAGPYANHLHLTPDRYITTPVLLHSAFTGWMPFLPPNQQRQSSEGIKRYSVYVQDIHGVFWEPLAVWGELGQWPSAVLMADLFLN